MLIDGQAITNLNTLSDNELRFTPPQSLTQGDKTITLTAKSFTENTKYEIEIYENFKVYNSYSPLKINDVVLSKSLLEIGSNYLIKLSATGGGHKNKKYELVSGNLPSGMHLTPSGNLIGSPSSIGIYNFFVRASDKTGEEDIKLFFFEVENNANSNRFISDSAQEDTKMSFKMYPNPTSDILNINPGGLDSSSFSIKIISSSGKIVFSKSNLNQTLNIDIKKFDNGTYIVELNHEGVVKNEKLIIIK